jgi:peroxiredoxin
LASEKRRIGRVLLILLEIGLAIALVYSIYWWRTHSLLPVDEPTAAPALSLTDLAGEAFHVGDLRGKPAVLYFFAPWCTVCNASAHQLRWFDEWLGDDVTLILVALDWDSVDELEDYRRRHRLTAPILLGDASVADAFRVSGYPTYYVLDSGGRVVRRDFGMTTVAGLWWRACVGVS